MAMTTTKVGRNPVTGKQVYRHSEASAADTAKTVTIPGGPGRKLLQVTVAYSASPTQTGVVVALDSGAGAAYDATLLTGSANARYTSYLPDQGVFIGSDDALTVTAPAAGGVITSAITVYTEE